MSMAVKASPTTGALPSAATADMGPGPAGPQASSATMSSRSIEELIAKFDEDSSSGLNQSEFSGMLGVLGTDPQVDTDGSGAVDQSELQKLLAGFDASVAGPSGASGADGGEGGGGGDGGSGGTGGTQGTGGSGGASATEGSGGSPASSEPDDSGSSCGTPGSQGATDAGGADLFTQADASGDGEVTADELRAMAAPSGASASAPTPSGPSGGGGGSPAAAPAPAPAPAPSGSSPPAGSDSAGGSTTEPQRASRAASQRDRGPSAAPTDGSSMFSQADADRSGEVTAQELGAPQPGGDMMQSVFSHIDGFDSSGDGVIQSDEAAAAAAQGQQGSPQATPAIQGAE